MRKKKNERTCWIEAITSVNWASLTRITLVLTVEDFHCSTLSTVLISSINAVLLVLRWSVKLSGKTKFCFISKQIESHCIHLLKPTRTNQSFVIRLWKMSFSTVMTMECFDGLDAELNYWSHNSVVSDCLRLLEFEHMNCNHSQMCLLSICLEEFKKKTPTSTQTDRQTTVVLRMVLIAFNNIISLILCSSIRKSGIANWFSDQQINFAHLQ